MAKYSTDPVLRHLVLAINETEAGGVPVTLSVHGTVVRGALVAERRYFAELVQRNPLLNALEPSTGLLGKEYAKDTESESDHHLHILAEEGPGAAAPGEGLWRISLESIDGWSLRHAATTAAANERGPFARLRGTA